MEHVENRIDQILAIFKRFSYILLLGKFTKDSDGYYVHCRWCGEGGTLYGCDDCIESFCKQCILRNLGRSAITEIEGGTKWKCYICNLARITECCEYAKKIQSSVTKYEEHNQEEKLKAEKRKLQKFEKAQAPFFRSSTVLPNVPLKCPVSVNRPLLKNDQQ